MSNAVKQGLFGTPKRLKLFWLLAIVAMVVLVLYPDPWLTGTLTGELLGLVGLVLTAIGMIGRSFCSVYVAGRKLSGLVTDGPYSVTRNPLYFFSFIGGIGVALGGQNLLVLALLIAGFLLYYPGVMRREEQLLEESHGDAFLEYKRSVPLFWPRLRGYREADHLEVRKPHVVRRDMYYTVYFAVAHALFALVATLHAQGLIGV